MSTHNDHEPEDRASDEIDASAGYERADIKVAGIVGFLAALGIFVVVTAFVCWGIGMFINADLKKEDIKDYGARSRWAKTVDVQPLGNLPTNPELQNKMAEMTESFPTPRLQTDDGNQDVANLHAREDLLLENYSWADRKSGKVRIPIERAMELVAQSGLPVAPAVEHAPLLTGDKLPVAAAPLTNGFARTVYELDEAAAEAVAGKRGEQRK